MAPFRRVAVRVALLALAATIAAVAPARGAAADEGWTIQRFHADIVIQHDGSLLITETVDAAFGTAKHGIYRDIPVRYALNGNTDRIYDLRVRSVTDAAGAPWHYQQSRQGRDVRLTIGDASRLVTGAQTYVITYEIRGALNGFADHDELYWNVNGGNWPVPAQEVSATVRLDGGGLGRAQCYEGRTGATEPCNYLGDDSRIGFVAARPLAAGEELTVVAAIRKGVVPAPAPRLVKTDPGFIASYFSISPWTAGAAVALLVAGLAFLLVNWWRNGRDRMYTTIYYLSENPDEAPRPLFHRDQVVVEYTPAADLRPAQMGMLLDEHVDQKDVAATIIDLAVRGYLTITELPKEWVLGHADWKLTRRKEPRGLKPYERTLFKGIMGDRDEVLLSDLHTDYWGALRDGQQQLYDEAVDHGWFARDPAVQRVRWQTFGCGVLIFGAALTWVLAAARGAGIVGLPVAFLGLTMIPFSGAMPKRTAKGSELLRRVLGFRMYIETAEKDRQRFNEQANIFAAYLPYAIVFGCAEKWARVFGDVQTEQVAGDWFQPSAKYSLLALSGHLETFSGAVAHSINCAPAVPGGSGGSGFFGGGGLGTGFGGGGFGGGGGGGFAGGGGGGGGGGSW